MPAPRSRAGSMRRTAGRRPCAARPAAVRISRSWFYLGDLGHDLAAAAQPPDADQVERAAQAANEDAVVGFAVTPRTVGHIDMDDAKTFAHDQRRKIPV